MVKTYKEKIRTGFIAQLLMSSMGLAAHLMLAINGYSLPGFIIGASFIFIGFIISSSTDDKAFRQYNNGEIEWE